MSTNRTDQVSIGHLDDVLRILDRAFGGMITLMVVVSIAAAYTDETSYLSVLTLTAFAAVNVTVSYVSKDRPNAEYLRHFLVPPIFGVACFVSIDGALAPWWYGFFIMGSASCISLYQLSRKFTWGYYAAVYNVVCLVVANYFAGFINTYQVLFLSIFLMTYVHLFIHFLKITNSSYQSELQKTQRLEAAMDKLAQAQVTLVEQSKFSALGEMAGGIAHEINNPLATIKMRVSQVRRLLAKGEFSMQEIEKFLTVAESTTDRIKNIVDALRTFSRSDANQSYVMYSLRKIIDESLLLSEERFRTNGIDLRIDEIPEDWTIECHPIQLSQVILNFLSNARHAVCSQESDRWVAIKVKDIGRTYAVTISDSGPGIPAEIQTKIMQPFFTTKEIGEGTGLGLSLSKGIVEDHGGTMKLDVNAPHTTFVIELPKVQAGKKTL